MKSQSGHVQEVDDTPGHERILNYHASGTYDEVSADGRRVVKVVGSNWTIVAYDDNIYIEGNALVDVKGNIQINCYNDAKINVAGRTELNSGEDIRIKGKSIHLESHTGDINFYSANGIKMHSTSNTNILSAQSFNVSANSQINLSATAALAIGSNTDIQVKATANVSITSGSDMNVLSGAKYVVSSTGVASIKSADNLNMDGTEVHIAEGLATDAITATAPNTAVDAIKSGLKTAPSRQKAAVTSAVEESVLGLDDDADDVSRAIDELVANGRLTQDEADEIKRDDTTPALEKDTAAAPKTTKAPAKNTTGLGSIPESAINNSLKLSTNYNLGNLTDNHPAAGCHTIKAQCGLTKAQIVNNLSVLCQNVIEPIRAKYGDLVIINSGFRQGTGKSQHFRGMAVDITYGAYSKNPDKIIEIAKWIRDNVVFDQLIVEYGNNQVWTHVSYNPTLSEQRRDIRTCRNPAKPVYEHGLIRYKAKWE